jgi:hypothetical protein
VQDPDQAVAELAQGGVVTPPTHWATSSSMSR